MHGRHLTILAAVAAILAMAIAAVAGAHPPAKHARAVKVARGATSLKLTTTLPGVTITPLKPAKAADGGIRFPIAAGRVQRTRARGIILHVGGLKLVKGDKTVVLRRPRAVLRGGASRLVVRVEGGRLLPLAKLGLAGVKPQVDGRKVTVTGVELSLTAAGSKALKAAFGLDVPAGTALGTADVSTRVIGRLGKGGGSYRDPLGRHGR